MHREKKERERERRNNYNDKGRREKSFPGPLRENLCEASLPPDGPGRNLFSRFTRCSYY